MQIAGEWFTDDDESTRPVVTAQALGAEARVVSEDFLVDSGADRTVLSTGFLRRLNLPTIDTPADFGLVGVGGGIRFALVAAVLEFRRTDGGVARVRGEYAAFLDSSKSDRSILGRDILDHFDVVLSRRRNEVWLLGTNHGFTISGG